MPKGPERRKTSPDVIGGMAKVVRIATGEETEELGQTPASAKPSRPLQPG